MVLEDSPSNSNSSILHQFLVLNSIADQNQFENQHFVDCGSQSHSLMPRSVDLLHAPQLSNESVSRHGTRSMNLLETSAAHQAQRLSLSLGSVMDPGYIIYYNTVLDRATSDYCFAGTGCAFISSAAMGSSKYLKPAQSLLEEMVNIGSKEIDSSNKKYMEKLSRRCQSGSFGYNEELSEKPGSCVHLLKFLALLPEVERRYEEYYNHMEELVSCFEAIAGLGAGKSYTALALQAMSKHFGILRNAILSQIRASKRKMEADMPRISSRLGQLSLLDQKSRHNRATLQQQQLGITQSWRLIRGLPENSVMILRAWLFEHFLHPYPNDSEKLVLASQTGLSKNQVSNWFINARVRMWKPMIEQMYKEEFGDSSIESDELLTITAQGIGDLC
ncbi:BEL1-like homeodomain protein 11 isoform X2 [Primulina huaijiensis]|uniref:BEL1-like homeodomain protein 11 isoform X2 n=1 Tax=Primulina huaijiensis TaxID=1492673 RepID=UPI003CC78CCF